MVSSFHPHSMCDRVEGNGKNSTHFVYKLDNLFRSIRVLDENSSVTRALQSFLNKSEASGLRKTSPNSNSLAHRTTWLRSDLSYMIVKLKITTKLTLKMLELGMVSSFHPHSMCEGVERVTAKTGCTSCTKRTISFKVSGFRTKNHQLHRLFNILIT